MKRPVFCGVLALGLCAAGTGQSIHSDRQHDAERKVSGEGFAATKEVFAHFNGQMIEAQKHSRGELWLEVSAEDGSEHVTMRIPLSSTEDAYGESRSCTVKDGKREMVFTSGLDEANFVEFEAAKPAHEFHLLLNKYLCRVLATPFQCGGETVRLPHDFKQWKIGKETSVLLSSEQPARAEVSPVLIVPGSREFDYARCAVVAPSNGMCCVGGRTTAWHCGGKPQGEGWHQVSGDCYHRETGGSCHD